MHVYLHRTAAARIVLSRRMRQRLSACPATIDPSPGLPSPAPTPSCRRPWRPPRPRRTAGRSAAKPAPSPAARSPLRRRFARHGPSRPCCRTGRPCAIRAVRSAGRRSAAFPAISARPAAPPSPAHRSRAGAREPRLRRACSSIDDAGGAMEGSAESGRATASAARVLANHIMSGSLSREPKQNRRVRNRARLCLCLVPNPARKTP